MLEKCDLNAIYLKGCVHKKIGIVGLERVVLTTLPNIATVTMVFQLPKIQHKRTVSVGNFYTCLVGAQILLFIEQYL